MVEPTTKINASELYLHVNGAHMPQYQCHKKVWALKIKAVEQHPEIRVSGIVQHKAYAVITFEDASFSPITWDAEFTGVSKPEAGWYYVVYEDGYRSFSPGKSFEDGYALVSKPQALLGEVEAKETKKHDDCLGTNAAIEQAQDPKQAAQQAKISGYRELSAAEIDLMNQVKAEGVVIGNLITKLQGLSALDQRWVNIGKTDLQTGLMALVRSIAQPTTF